MRTEQGMVCPQVPSAMTHPTALPSQPLLMEEFAPPPSPRHCRGQTRRHRRTSLWSSLGLQTQQREGDFWSSSTGHCRSRCQEWEEDEQLCRPERAVAPVSAAHTETVGKPGASCLLLRQDWGSACPMAMTSTFSQRGQWLGNMP